MMRDGMTGDWIGTFAGHKGAVHGCRLDETASLAATASGDFSVQVWDAITGKSLLSLPHQHIVKTTDFSPNSQLLATGGHEGILRIYDLTTLVTGKKNESSVHPVQEIKMDPAKKIVISKISWLSNTHLVAGCGDGALRVWDISTDCEEGPLHTLHTDEGVEVRDMEVSATAAGRRILTVAAGTKVTFFDLEDYSRIHSYKMPIHFREEGGASLHPDGTKFIAGGSDLWVRVFDFETGEELECLKGHHGPIRCLRYSPDGSIYASGSEDGTIRLWQSESDE
jgi:serine-threonine kinase receptor-associated protein